MITVKALDHFVLRVRDLEAIEALAEIQGHMHGRLRGGFVARPLIGIC